MSVTSRWSVRGDAASSPSSSRRSAGVHSAVPDTGGRLAAAVVREPHSSQQRSPKSPASPADERLVQARYGDLLRLGLWLLAERRPAADAATDTLALARRLRPEFRRPWQLRIWLYRMMARRCWQTLRHTARPGPSLVWDGDLGSRAPHPSQTSR